MSGLHAVISRLLICKNSPSCSMYSFSSSRRRFSLLHLLICDWGWNGIGRQKRIKNLMHLPLFLCLPKTKNLWYAWHDKQMSMLDKSYWKFSTSPHLIFRLSSYFFSCSWRTCHVWYYHIHYFWLLLWQLCCWSDWWICVIWR